MFVSARYLLVLVCTVLFAGSWVWAFYSWFRMLGARVPGATIGDLWLLQDEFLTEAGRQWRGRWFRWILVGAVFGAAAALIAK